MSRVRDEPLLPLYVLRKGEDGILGEEQDKEEDQNQAARPRPQGHEEQGAHELQGIRHIQEQDGDPPLVPADEIPIFLVITFRLLPGEDLPRIFSGHILIYGGDMVSGDEQDAPLRVAVGSEKAGGELRFRPSPRHVLHGGQRGLGPVEGPLLPAQEIRRHLIPDGCGPIKIYKIDSRQQHRHHRPESRHGRQDEASSHLLQHPVSSIE